MSVLRSALFALLAYAVTVLTILVCLPVALIDRRALARLTRLWARILYALTRHVLGIRTVVEGALPGAPVLFAAKHESAYETIVLMALVDDPVVVLKRELAYIPLFGWLTRRHGVIPVDRSASAAALRLMLHAADVAKTLDRPVLIYPEGTRVEHGQSPKLQAGFAGLYARLALPVVPVATDAGLVWQRRFVKHPGTIRFRFGAPIPPGLPRKTIEAEVHAAINGLNR